MKKLKNIIGILLGLFIFYLITSYVWSFLNIQKCSYSLPKNPTCEQIAKNNSDNCKYVIMKWKRVEYSKELQQCKEWEQKQEKIVK